MIGHEWIWDDHDFATSPPGWRALYLFEESYIETPVVGWITQVQTKIDPHTWEEVDQHPRSERDRRVVAAIAEEGFVSAAYQDGNFWCVLGPGQSDPTPAEAKEEIARRTEFERRRVERAALQRGAGSA